MPIEVEIKKAKITALITFHHRAYALLPNAMIANTIIILDILFFLQGFIFIQHDEHQLNVLAVFSFQFKKQAAFLRVVCLNLLQLSSLALGWRL